MKKIETKTIRNKKTIFIVVLSLIVILVGFSLFKVNNWRVKIAAEYKRAGKIAKNENNLGLAILNYKKVLVLSPYNQEVASAIGETYYSVGEYEKAINYFKRVRGSSDILNKIGDIYYQKEDFDQSNKYYQKSTKISSNSYAYIGIGKCFLKLGEIDKANESFKKALEADPNFYEASFYFILTLTHKDSLEAEKKSKFLNKYDQNENNLKKAISNINSGDILYGKTILANLFNDLAFPKSAILVLDPEIKENTTYRDAFLVLANIYLELKNYDKAIQNSNKAVDIDPIYIPSYQLLSQIYKEKGDSKKSQEYLDKITALEIK